MSGSEAVARVYSVLKSTGTSCLDTENPLILRLLTEKSSPDPSELESSSLTAFSGFSTASLECSSVLVSFTSSVWLFVSSAGSERFLSVSLLSWALVSWSSVSWIPVSSPSVSWALVSSSVTAAVSSVPALPELPEPPDCFPVEDGCGEVFERSPITANSSIWASVIIKSSPMIRSLNSQSRSL